MISSLSQSSHIQTGAENSRKRQDRKRKWRKPDGGTVHSEECPSRQSTLVRDTSEKKSRNRTFEKRETKLRNSVILKSITEL